MFLKLDTSILHNKGRDLDSGFGNLRFTRLSLFSADVFTWPQNWHVISSFKT
jgi:hypothetical protein